MFKKYTMIALGMVLLGGEASGMSYVRRLWAPSAVAVATVKVQSNSNTSKSQLKEVKPGHVRVYHRIGRGGTIDSVKNEGLLTYKELYRRGLAISNLSGGLPDQYDVIYFAWSPKPPVDQNSVGFDVDPHTTYVNNREFRFDGNSGYYQGSEVLLADYIAKRAEAEKLRQSALPGMQVIFDPFTAAPFCVASTDKRFHEDEGPGYWTETNKIKARHYIYLNEIIFRRSCIPAEELVFPDEDALR